MLWSTCSFRWWRTSGITSGLSRPKPGEGLQLQRSGLCLCTQAFLVALANKRVFCRLHWTFHFLCSDGIVDEDMELPLSQEKLFLLTSCQPVVDYLNTCDHILYQCIVDFLIPDVLRPIPGTLTQAIRNFAKSLEGWLVGAIQAYPSLVVQSKVTYIEVKPWFGLCCIRNHFVCTIVFI